MCAIIIFFGVSGEGARVDEYINIYLVHFLSCRNTYMSRLYILSPVYFSCETRGGPDRCPSKVVVFINTWGCSIHNMCVLPVGALC